MRYVSRYKPERNLREHLTDTFGAWYRSFWRQLDVVSIIEACSDHPCVGGLAPADTVNVLMLIPLAKGKISKNYRTEIRAGQGPESWSTFVSPRL